MPQLPGGKNGAPLMVFGENDAQVDSKPKVQQLAAFSGGNAHQMWLATRELTCPCCMPFLSLAGLGVHLHTS